MSIMIQIGKFPDHFNLMEKIIPVSEVSDYLSPKGRRRRELVYYLGGDTRVHQSKFPNGKNGGDRICSQPFKSSQKSLP